MIAWWYLLLLLVEEAVERNMSLLRSIQACTDQYSSFDWIGLEKSGNIEEWISVPDSIGPLGPGECEEVWLNITTPETMELGMHQGSINFSNGFGESSILEIELVAGGKTGDVSGPEVHNITIPGNTFADSAISFFANAADNLSSVHSCTISVDSGPWLSMQAADGIFDSPEEEIIFTYPKGFGRGKHDVRMRCKDSSGNVGPEANMTFRLARELIFIQSGKEMSLSEREWSEWLSIYKSGLGFRWSHETVRADELMGIDLDDYAVVVMADYQDRPLLDMKLGSHLDSGGYLVLLGEANVEGAYALCQPAGAISTYPDKTVRVYMTDHYMASELKPGLLRIFTIDTKLYRMEGDYIGAPVIVHGSDSGFTVLGDSSGIVSWGVASPFRLNEDGIALTTRIIDYAILASHKHPGQ